MTKTKLFPIEGKHERSSDLFFWDDVLKDEGPESIRDFGEGLEEIGRRVRGTRVEQVNTLIDAAQALIDGLQDFITWAAYADELPEGFHVETEKGKGPGRGWWGPPRGTHGPGDNGEGKQGGLRYKASDANVASAKKAAGAQLSKIAEDVGVATEEIRVGVARRLEEDLNRPIAIRRGVRGATNIIEEGRFKTQLETGTSGGFFAPKTRVNVEETGLGAPRDLPPQERPVYGYFKTREHTAGSYGAVEFVLKDSVKDRTTYTVGDSLGPFGRGQMVGGRKASDTQSWDTHSLTNYYFGGARQANYIEAQIQGGIFLSDVSKVVLHSRSLTSNTVTSLRNQLTAKGIEVEIDAETR